MLITRFFYPLAEHIQSKTDEDIANIPLWFGVPTKDTFMLADYSAKIDAAQDHLTQDEATTFRFFKRSLRGSALSWLHTWLIRNRDAPRQWTTVKQELRKNFGDSTAQQLLRKMSKCPIWQLFKLTFTNFLHTLLD